MEEKCRLCLMSSKRLVSLFDYQGNISYAEMLLLVAQLKVCERDNYSNICRSCCKNLRESYHFILKIFESDDILQNSLHVKRIKFTNFEDIKMKIEIDYKEKTPVVKKEEINDTFNIEGKEFYYHNTLIRRITKIDKEKKPMNVLDFLLNDNGEDNDVDDPDYEDGGENYDNHEPEMSDEDLPLRPRIKRRQIKIKKLVSKRKRRVIENSCTVLFKPVYLTDVIIKPDKKKKKVLKEKTVCPYCGQFYTDLDTHIITHTGTKNVECDKCDKKFFSQWNLKMHVDRCHPKQKDLYKCEHCVASFGDKGSFRSHLTVHTDIKKHVCSLCNKAFKRKGTWRRHIQLMHDFAARHKIKCSLCPLAFPDLPRLRHHMRIHTGERPYKCELCSQPYSYKRDFNRHCLKKHGVSLKRRNVPVMNAEVLSRERRLMHELLMQSHSVLKSGSDVQLGQFQGPLGALAYHAALNDLKSDQIPIDLKLTDS